MYHCCSGDLIRCSLFLVIVCGEHLICELVYLIKYSIYSILSVRRRFSLLLQCRETNGEQEQQNNTVQSVSLFLYDESTPCTLKPVQILNRLSFENEKIMNVAENPEKNPLTPSKWLHKINVDVLMTSPFAKQRYATSRHLKPYLRL